MPLVELKLHPQPGYIIKINQKLIKIFQFINQGHKKINGRTWKDKTQTGKILTCEKYLV